MPYKLNPVTGVLDLIRASADTSLTTNIPQYNTDPASPIAQSAWVLRTGGAITGGGTLQGILGLSTYLVSVGSGGASTYQFSYRTLEGTTKRATIS